VKIVCAVGIVAAVVCHPSSPGRAVARAQSAPQSVPPAAPQAAQAPTFKSGVELISIDVSVVDKNGTPIKALKADQFDVEIDGRPRRVVSADYVEHAPQAAVPAAAPNEPLRPAFSSNQAASLPTMAGRLIFIVVDQESFRPAGAKAAMEAARRFVDHLQPADRVGLISSPVPGPSVAATRNRALVRERLLSITGTAESIRASTQKNITLEEALDIRAQDDALLETVSARECQGLNGNALQLCIETLKSDAEIVVLSAQAQVARSLQGLRNVLDGLARIEERKTIVLISGGLPANDRSGGGLNTRTEIGVIAGRAAMANANIYVLHVDTSFQDAFSADRRTSTLEGTFTRDAAMMEAGLDALARSSGGMILRVVTQADTAFERIARETAASYLLGVEPTDADRNGKLHTIEVKVKSPGVTVRSRREFVLPAKPTQAAGEDAVTAALRAPRPPNEFPLGVSTHVLGPESNGSARVLVTAKVGSGLTGQVDVRSALRLTDVAGRVLVDSPPANQRLLASPPDGAALWVSTVTLPVGDYILRLAMADATGRAGAVDHTFSVVFGTGEGVTMGNLLLLDPSGPANVEVPAIPDGVLRGNRVDAHIEFQARAGSTTDVAFGIADAPEGDFLVRSKGVLNKKGTSGRRAADGRLDISLLPPGDYVAGAVLSEGNKRLGRRYEPVRIERARPSDRAEPAAAAGGAPRVRFVLGDSARLVKAFSRDDVLSADALSYFIGRLQDADKTPPPEVAEAIAALRAKQYARVLTALKDAPSENLSVAFLRGIALLADGALEPAAARFRDALRTADDFLPAAFYLGTCYAAGGRDDEAVGAWQTALVAETDARIIYDVLVDALLRLEHADDAADIIEEAQARWPDESGFLPRLAVAEAMRQHREAALQKLGVHLESHPGDAESAGLAVRLIYDAHVAGGGISSPEADTALAQKYAALYRAAGGANRALIERWVAFIVGK
jgi:VWFA-related protein